MGKHLHCIKESSIQTGGKEFYNCAYVKSHREIKTRVNNEITVVSLVDFADALNISLVKGEKYNPRWFWLN